MPEFNNVGLKPKTYAWLLEFRKGLEEHLERKVTFNEAEAILIGFAAKGASGDKLARAIAPEYEKWPQS